MGFYQRHVLPRLLHLAMRQEALLPFRRRVIAGAEGRVLEIGIGSGLNLPLYGPSARTVIGLEPSPELLAMARERAAAAPVPVRWRMRGCRGRAPIPSSMKAARCGRDHALRSPRMTGSAARTQAQAMAHSTPNPAPATIRPPTMPPIVAPSAVQALSNPTLSP